jgi:hypothetical protein
VLETGFGSLTVCFQLLGMISPGEGAGKRKCEGKCAYIRFLASEMRYIVRSSRGRTHAAYFSTGGSSSPALLYSQYFSYLGNVCKPIVI